MALGEPDEREGDLLPTAEDLEGGDDDGLADALCGDDSLLEATGAGLPPPVDDEIGELPDGLDESQLTEPEDVDLSKHELTVPQARRVAQVLAQNGSLSKVKLPAHSLAISDLEDDELEWDSEEYTDVDAVRSAPVDQRILCAAVAQACARSAPACTGVWARVGMLKMVPGTHSALSDTSWQIIIAELLKANETVKRLDLARNNIGDAGACAIAQMLCTNTSIEYLNLESNEFGERGAWPLACSQRLSSALQAPVLWALCRSPCLRAPFVACCSRRRHGPGRGRQLLAHVPQPQGECRARSGQGHALRQVAGVAARRPRRRAALLGALRQPPAWADAPRYSVRSRYINDDARNLDGSAHFNVAHQQRGRFWLLHVSRVSLGAHVCGVVGCACVYVACTSCTFLWRVTLMRQSCGS